MSEAPKKIWFDLDSCSAGPVPFNDDEVPYIRADIFDELVEALEGMLDWFGYPEEHECSRSDKARAAIAKAKGESNE